MRAAATSSGSAGVVDRVPAGSAQSGGSVRSPTVASGVAGRQTRVWYSPVRVSTRIVSPVSTKIGTGDHESGLGRGRLAGAGLRVAGEAGLGLGDHQVDGHRQLDADRLALVAGPVERHPVLEVLGRLAELLGASARTGRTCRCP